MSNHRTTRFSRIKLRYVWIVAIINLVGCRSLENHFIYNPHVYPQGWNEFSDPCIEETWFSADDGTRLHGLFVRHADPRAVILFAHGRRGNVTSPIESLLSFVQRHRVSVFIFDYRGFGRSEGEPSEAGLYQDARAAQAWLAKRANILKPEVIVMGRSLGAAIATELAANEGAKALIIESGFTSLPHFVSHHVPLAPAQWMLFSKFDSLKHIAKYDGPVLISHGTHDRVIPFSHGKDLFHAAPGPKRFFSVVGGSHEWESGPDYHLALDQFIDSVGITKR